MTNPHRAHAALCLGGAPFLKHYPRGRFQLWRGVGFTGNSLPGPGFNFAAAVGPSPRLDKIVAEGTRFFAGDAWGVLVEGDAGHPVEAELRSRGWPIAEDEPAYVLSDLASGEFGPFRAFQTEDDRRTFLQVCCTAYGSPPEMAEMFMPSLAFALDPAMGWFVSPGAEIVGGYYRVGSAAVIGCLACLPEHRGRGFGARLVRHMLAHAAERGCTHAALRSGPLSVPLYERLGFRYACQHRTYAVPGNT